LRPPGLEHLNSPGPLYALNEDQAVWKRSKEPEHFLQKNKSQPMEVPTDIFLYGTDDAPWSQGRSTRTAEDAIAEYWGENHEVTSTQPFQKQKNLGYAHQGNSASWDNAWEENGGSRFMRYESIPFWQQGGRQGIDYDIEETLGTESKELDGHVRRWDMDRVTLPRGQEYKRYGAR